MRLFARCLVLACLLCGTAATPAAPRPQRIVSLNLCADQILLALADRSQIAGLTRNAADPEMSAAAAQARGLPILRTSAEQIIALRPDLLVGLPGQGRGGIGGRRYPVLELPMAESLAAIETSIRKAAPALGHADRGDALVARIRRELAAVPRLGRGRVAAYYQRRGFLTGTGTVIDELMARAGLVNLATRLGKPTLSRVSLEEMVAAKPDFLIVETATDRVSDQGSEMLHHPALAAVPRISMPQGWTVCGGPAYVLAARSIAAQIAAHDRGRPR